MTVRYDVPHPKSVELSGYLPLVDGKPQVDLLDRACARLGIRIGDTSPREIARLLRYGGSPAEALQDLYLTDWMASERL